MLEIFLVILSATLGSTCFAILFRVPRHYTPHTILLGLLTCIAIRYTPTEWSIAFSTFVVALGASSFANLLARVTRNPAQAFLVPGVIFLVPGSFIYRALSSALTQNMPDAMKYFLDATMISLAISFGLLLANWFLPSKRSL
jgi:uncharacterized membrane protein YjjB (DUF3815 family)